MQYLIDIQNASPEALPLTDDQLQQLAALALKELCNTGAEITLRLVSVEEITSLNQQYRKKNTATNVLAFPSNLPKDLPIDPPFLGDVVICPLVLQEESIQYRKDLLAHWSLIVIHGVLHLLGYDHIEDADAAKMQAIEIKLLTQLGYENPYSEEDAKLE